MQTPKSNKRIVSKAEYLEIMGIRFVGYSTLAVLLIIGATGTIFAGLGVVKILLMLIQGGGMIGLLLVALIALLCFLSMTLMVWKGFTAIGEEEIVPLTRQTALDIPAEESLLRASSADTLADETILLRPAQAQSDTANEELLRPHHVKSL